MVSEILFELCGLIVLLVAAAFFAGSETALTGASRARMHTLENEGNARAGLVNRLRERKERLIGALLLGNTLVSVSIGSLATSATIATIGETFVLPVTFTVAVLMLVFSEVMPKTYALINADRLALILAPMVSFCVSVFSPVTHAVEKIVNFLFKILKVDHAGQSHEAQQEELRGAIDLLQSPEEGKAENQERRAMLRSVLDLADVEVEKIMVHRKNIKTLDAELPIEKIVDEVLHSSFTRMPVWKDNIDNIVGVIHAKLLLKEIRACNGDIAKIDLSKAMMDPWFVPDTTTLFDQLQAFRKRGERFSIVVDEYGVLKGVLTLEDILEEIVGKMRGEHDASVTGIRPQPDGSFLVDGKVTIRDLNRELDWGMPDEDYATVAGLLLYETQRIPSVGQAFSFYGFRFDVLKKQRNQLTLLRITPGNKMAMGE